MVMVMPPYHGATIRAKASTIFPPGLRCGRYSDHDPGCPVTFLGAPLLARMAREIPQTSFSRSRSQVAKTSGATRKAATPSAWNGEETLMRMHGPRILTASARKPFRRSRSGRLPMKRC